MACLYQWWKRSYFWDEFYQKVVVRPVVGGAENVLAPFDNRIIDGLVNAVARTAQGISSMVRYLQTGVVQVYALAIVFGVVVVIALMVF